MSNYGVASAFEVHNARARWRRLSTRSNGCLVVSIGVARFGSFRSVGIFDKGVIRQRRYPSGRRSYPARSTATRSSTRKRIKGSATRRAYGTRRPVRTAQLPLLFAHKRDGYFIDLASNQPIFLSNTRSLERDFGWKGLCIDGSLDLAIKALERRTCQPVQAIVTNHSWRYRPLHDASKGLPINPPLMNCATRAMAVLSTRRISRA